MTLAQPVSVLSASTSSVPESQRLEYWQTLCREFIGTVSCEDFDESNFHASLSSYSIEDLKIFRFDGTRQSINRDQRIIRPSDVDDYIVLLESENVFSYEHNGRQHTGQDAIVLFDVTKPWAARHHDRMLVTDISIPRKRLEAALGGARLAAGLIIEPSQKSYPILVSFLRSFIAQAPMLSPASGARMATIAVDLIAAGFAEKMEREHTGTFASAATLCRAKAYIDANLCKPGLAMEEIAAAVGLSVRRLHQLANEENISLPAWMWERRLARAQALLSDSAHRMLSVSSVGYMCGFSDHAHFSRRFKARFGLTPTECRARRLSQASERLSAPGSSP